MQFLKQVSMHPRDRLARKIKTINNDVKFIKPVPSHLRDRLARKTRDMWRYAETIQYDIENDTKMVHWQVSSKKSSKHMTSKKIQKNIVV